MDKIQAIKDAALSLLDRKVGDAKLIIKENYPFNKLASTERKYTDKQKMEQFIRDGFIDRYSGQKLMNPGILKVLSYYCHHFHRRTLLSNSIRILSVQMYLLRD